MQRGSRHPHSRVFRAIPLGAAVLCTLGSSVAAQQARTAKHARSAGLDLSSGSSVVILEGNRVFCEITNQGNLCTDVIAAPWGGGAYWPFGPPTAVNEYIFNSGLQVAGIVAPGGGPWARDTVGAFFFDASGLRPSGQQVTGIYSSAYADHFDAWPAGAYVRDAALYDATLVGRAAISQEDSWVRYQDGPTLVSGRSHAMGILVEQRSLQFTYPVGNEDIIYWVFTLTNITASDPSAYAEQDPATRWEIAEIGAQWVAQTEARVGIDLPASGVRFDSLFVALGMDPDVGNASENNSTAILPFETSVAYKSDFNEPTWQYPPSIATTPFGPYPGFVGVALLKTPPRQDGGETPRLTVFSNVTNGGAFPDPNNVARLWRYLSATYAASEGDFLCDINPPRERRLCAVVQTPGDTRFFQSTGPFSLRPGESATFVMAYVFAAAIASEIEPYYNGVLEPWIPPSGPDLVAGADTLRVLERAAGWLSHADLNGDGDLTPNEVQTVPRSFLHKVKLARSLVELGFLLPSAPEAPEFFLVPGDNSVTVAWQRSTTETIGDPYYSAAADSTSGLYDPNYRQNDVEGYRIYRGRRPDQLELIAQFDYEGTTFLDYTGALDYGQGCAPELGILDRCPTFPYGRQLDGNRYVPLVQIPIGGRVLVGNNLAVLEADTLFANSEFYLHDSGVPFAFVDDDVENFYPYYYAVTAFDVNSIASGPSSLESPIVAKSVVPRRDAGNLGSAVVSAGLYGRDCLLDQAVQFSFDGTTGTFEGSPPPTGLLKVLSYDLVVPNALQAGAIVELRVDSVVPRYYDGTYYMTLESGGQTTEFTLTNLPEDRYDHSPSLSASGPIPADPALAAAIGQTGLPLAGNAELGLRVEAIAWYSGDTEWHKDVDGSFWTSQGLTGLGGSRWFTGDDESTPQQDGVFWRGVLPGVSVIFSPQPNYSGNVPDPSVYALFRRLRQSTWQVARQADVKFYWGATPGTVDSVIDATHNVRVPFMSSDPLHVYQAGWGFRDDIAGQSTSYEPADGMVSEYDFVHGPCVVNGLPSHSATECADYPLRQQATLQPVDVTADGVADGNGFALYFNHEFYIFQTDQLPSNTVWTHRSYFGLMDGTPGAYTFTPKPANAAVPGVAARVIVDSAATLRTTTADDLERVHTVPDPFYVSSALETSPSHRVLKFVNLPDRVIIRIYSVSGVLVDVIEHSDAGLGGEATWDVRNRNGRVVASGVYFYHVETPDGAETIGRFTVITGGNFGVPNGGGRREE